MLEDFGTNILKVACTRCKRLLLPIQCRKTPMISFTISEAGVKNLQPYKVYHCQACYNLWRKNGYYPMPAKAPTRPKPAPPAPNIATTATYTTFQY